MAYSITLSFCSAYTTRLSENCLLLALLTVFGPYYEKHARIKTFGEIRFKGSVEKATDSATVPVSLKRYNIFMQKAVGLKHL